MAAIVVAAIVVANGPPGGYMGWTSARDGTLTTDRVEPAPAAKVVPAEDDEALLAELRAELDEGAADVAAGRVIGAARHEEMRRFMAELRRDDGRETE